MKAAPIPSDESDRLAALYRYRILDTEAEELFDSIVNIASTICDTPIALISLIDPERQWFKASKGLDATETPRDLAFCAHAILKPKELLVVPDATKDERFADNPLVAGAPDIRFYAGAPLVTSDNQALGTLCVIDKKPRELTEKQIKALRHLSQQVCANLELRLQKRRLEELNETKNRLFSLISHDLRSPLNSVLSIAEILESDDYQLEETEEKEFISHLIANVHTTLRIAENLLEIAQFEQGRYNFSPEEVSLLEMAEVAQQSLSGKLRAKNIALSIDCDEKCSAWVDPKMTQSILQNLLSNAAKFTSKGGRIEMKVMPNGTNTQITITDSGTGIKPNTLKTLFDVESCYSTEGTEGEKGSGLGLSLCKRFAKRLGGDLEIESKFGHGTKAILTIPAIASPESQPS